MTRNELITNVKSYIYQNNENGISGDEMQNVMINMINSLYDALEGSTGNYLGNFTYAGSLPTPLKSGYYILNNAINYSSGNISVNGNAGDYLSVIVDNGYTYSIVSMSSIYQSSLNLLSSELNIDKLYPLSTGYYTLSTAIAAVSNQLRSVNAKITFKSAANTVETWVFTSMSDWENIANWMRIPVKKDIQNVMVQRQNIYEYNALLSKYKNYYLDYDKWIWVDAENTLGVTPLLGNTPIWETATDGFITIPITNIDKNEKYFGVIFECLCLKNQDQFGDPDCYLQINGQYTPFTAIKNISVGNRYVYYGYYGLSNITDNDIINLILAIHVKGVPKPATNTIVAEFSNVRLFYIDDLIVDGLFTVGDLLQKQISDTITFPARIISLEQNKLDKRTSSNLLDPDKFRYGYFYYRDQDSILHYDNNNNLGCTDYIPVSQKGLITVGAGRVTQGLSSYVVFDVNKNWLRNGQDSDQYIYQDGDGYIVFVYYVGGNLDFARDISVVEGTTYFFDKYTEYKPLLQLEERVNTLENNIYSVKLCENGTPIVYANVSNFSGNTIIERNIKNDYLIYKKTGTGNEWACSPMFVPQGINLVHIKFKVEFTKVGTNVGLTIYIANSTSTDGHYDVIKDGIINDGEYDITFDPAYFAVYKGYTQFCVWIDNQGMDSMDDVLTAKLTGLQVVEYANSVSAVNISGNNAKELFETTDEQITNIKNQLNDKAELISPIGNVFEIGVTDNGNIVTIPIIPQTGAFFGNSLIAGFGYGMAASENTKDYYYLITEYIKTLVSGFTAPRIAASEFEGLINLDDVDSVINTVFLNNLTGNENIVSIQLGDNVNTPEKIAIFPDSSLRLCKSIRAKCPNARVVWMGIWFGNASNYAAIQNACIKTGCTFITLADLVSNSTQNAIGNITKRGNATRTLNNVTNVILNSESGDLKNITISFTVGNTSYNSVINVYNYNLDSSVLTYTSDYEIIDSGGVAAHPNDEGFRKIANRFLYKMKLTDSEEYYPMNN